MAHFPGNRHCSAGSANTSGARARAELSSSLGWPSNGVVAAIGARRMNSYRGPDRRGIINRTCVLASLSSTAASVVAVLALPWLGVAVVSLVTVVSVRAWSTGLTDSTFVAYIVVASLLLWRWRLLGEELPLTLAAVMILIGMAIVPTFAPLGGNTVHGYLASLRAISVVLVLVCCTWTLRSAEIYSALRPVTIVTSMLIIPVVISLPLGLSPARVLVLGSVDGFRVMKLIDFVACTTLAVVLAVNGYHRHRLLFVSTGAVLLSIGAACASSSYAATADTTWQSLPPLFLLVGVVVLLAVVAEEARLATNTVVLHDVRGSRRWEAAELRLAVVQRDDQGRRHDVTNMLSAVDGTLLVLQRGGGRFTAQEIDRLMAAAREQVHWLRALLVERDEAVRTYDLSELLQAIVSLRALGAQPIRCEVQSGLEVRGRPDRMAIVVNNLLTNACIHSSNASVLVRATRLLAPRGEVVELVVSDNGPGLPNADLERAFDRGWRGSDGEGSGLGLYQCRVLTESEGGEISLGPTDPLAAPGHRGLTARVRIPICMHGPDDCALPVH